MTSWLVLKSAHEWLVIKRPMTLGRSIHGNRTFSNDDGSRKCPSRGAPSGMAGAPGVPGRVAPEDCSLSFPLIRTRALTHPVPQVVEYRCHLGASAFHARSAAHVWPTDHPGVRCTGCS